MTLEAGSNRARGTRYGYRRSTPAVPPIKTLPSAPDASVTFFDATTRDLTVGGGAASASTDIDSPVLCDGTLLPARRRVQPIR